MLYETEAVVLSTMDLGEHDRVAVMLTKDGGSVRAVVAGARKPKSRLASSTQPLTKGRFQLYRGRSMDRVTQAVLIDSHPEILGDYTKLLEASSLAELASHLSQEGETGGGVYGALVAALDAYRGPRESWTVTRWGELRILLSAGFLPSLSACALCGGKADGGSFSAHDGGILCDDCLAGLAPGRVPLRVSAGAIRTLAILAQSPGCPNLVARGSVRAEATAVMREFITHTLGRPLRSFALLERLEREVT